MSKFTLKRSVYFISLSGFALLVLFMVGFVLVNQVVNGQSLSTIDANSLLFISLRVSVYGLIVALWYVLINRLATIPNVKVNNRQFTLERLSHYRLPMMLCLFEYFFVQQGWATLVQAMR